MDLPLQIKKMRIIANREDIYLEIAKTDISDNSFGDAFSGGNECPSLCESNNTYGEGTGCACRSDE